MTDGHTDPAEQLGDFTTTTRMLPVGLLAIAIGVVSAVVAKLLLALIDIFTNLFFFQQNLGHARLARGSHAWSPCRRRAGRGRPGHRRHGTVRVRADPRARHSRSDRGHPHQRKPRRAQGRALEAAVVRDLDWIGRTVRRRRSHHHDGWSRRFPRRAVLPPHECRTEDPPGRRGSGRDVGDIRRSSRLGPPCSGAPAVRMEAEKPRSSSTRSRDSRGRATLPARPGSHLSSRAASRLHRARRTGWLRCVRTSRGSALGAPDARRLRFGGCVQPAADPLDVVARHRRRRHRRRRSVLPAGSRRGLRDHRRSAAG